MAIADKGPSVHIYSLRHPLIPLDGQEIARASAIVRNILRGQAEILETLRFKNISLHEPPKALLLPYLNAEKEGVPVHARPFVPRCAAVVWTAQNEQILCETIVSLDSGTEAPAGTTRVERGKGYASLDR